MSITLTPSRGRVLCSTGALIGRPNGRDFTLLDACAGQIDCDGYEFMMYDTWYDRLADLRAFMHGFQAPIPVFHVEKSVGDCISRNEDGDTERALSNFRINCALAAEFGAELLVLHLWGGLPSDRDIAHNIAVYADLRRIADAHGLLLTVENVVCNHADPMTHLHTLADTYPDIAFTFDTKMAAFHDQLPRLYEQKAGRLIPHIRHMHINDYGGGYLDWSNLRTLHIGDGHIDFAPLFAFLKEHAYTGDFTVEATSFDASGIIHFNKLNESIRTLRRFLTTEPGGTRA